MKKVLLIAFAALFIAGFAYATDWIGLFTDAGHTLYAPPNPCPHPEDPSCLPVGPVSFTLYVFVDMIDHDMSAVEFKLVFPPHVVRSGPVINGPLVFGAIAMPDIEHDISFAYSACYFGWTEVCHMSCTATYPEDYKEVVGIAAGDLTDPRTIQVSDCDGNIWEPAVLQQVTGTQSASWGTIKSLF